MPLSVFKVALKLAERRVSRGAHGGEPRGKVVERLIAAELVSEEDECRVLVEPPKDGLRRGRLNPIPLRELLQLHAAVEGRAGGRRPATLGAVVCWENCWEVEAMVSLFRKPRAFHSSRGPWPGGGGPASQPYSTCHNGFYQSSGF